MAAERDLRCGYLANHHLLVKQLDMDALLPDLVTSGLITPDENELISSESTGAKKTDRFLMILHRRGSVDSSVYQKLLDLLSDESVSAGQNISETLKQIETDSCREEIKARFAAIYESGGAGVELNAEESVVKSLSPDEVLPQLVSQGVVTWNENEGIRSKPTREDQARELYHIVRRRGAVACDNFVQVLLETESQSRLGEILKNKLVIHDDEKYAAHRDSKEFQRLLEECIKGVATKFYNLGVQETRARFKAVGDDEKVAAGPPPPPRDSEVRSVAEQVKKLSDKLHRDILEETNVAFVELFTTESSFTVTRQRVRLICAKIMVKHHQLFPSGWHQIAFVYYAMMQVILAVRKEAGKASSETRELQVANFVYPALAELGLVVWLEKHGGMEKFGSPVKGEGATLVIEESPED